jgi:hypothetical protein
MFLEVLEALLAGSAIYDPTSLFVIIGFRVPPFTLANESILPLHRTRESLSRRQSVIIY